MTHSLVGVAIAEAALLWRGRRAEPPVEPVRRLAWAAALVGANLPDSDMLWSWLTEGRLGYLLHHRGHSHTFVGLVPQFILAWIFLKWLGKRRSHDWTRGEWIWTGIVLALSLLSHVILDAFNSYGVHLLWPFDNRWFYGDTLFILEPWLWLTLIPGLYYSATTRLSRFFLSATFAVGAMMSLLSGNVPWFLSIPLVLVGVSLWRMVRRVPREARWALSVLAAVVPVIAFTLLSRNVKRSLSLPYAEPSTVKLRDAAITPMPANPFCWFVMTLETYDKDRAYRIRSGVYATFPMLVPPSRCPTLGLEERTAELLPTEASGDEHLLWMGEIRNTVANLRRLAAHCQVAAFLRFARLPFFQEAGRDLLMGDLRFDRQRGLGFAEIQTLRDPLRCPTYVPNWDPPLGDLVSLPAKNP